MRILLGLVQAFFLASSPALAAYNLVKDYSGTSFFNGWDFKDGFDNTTNGDVNYLNQSAATAGNLVSVNSAGNAIIRIDNASFVQFNLKRNSVFLSTHEFFPVGSVFIFDAVHIPFGCSVWPSFWTRGPDWPTGGEIDILEAVNLATSNQMTLHTSAGCTQASNVSQLGTTVGTNCSDGVNSAIGCTVMDKQANSFGDAFNNAGGGVWAAQFETTGIFIWFWSRNDVPSSVTNANNTIDPNTFGTPSAAWPASSCDVGKFFTPQQLIIDITLCGDFAGTPSIYQQTCAKPGENVVANTCYVDNVINNGTNYADAYFEIPHVKVFSQGNALDPVVSGSSTILTSITSVPTGGSGNSTANKNAGTTRVVSPNVFVSIFSAISLVVVAWMTEMVLF